MKPKRPWSHLPLGVLFALLLGCTAPEPRSEPTVAHVVNVHEGHTITALYQGRYERIRLHGIDCPEQDQAYGREAMETTAGLTLYKNVTIDEKGRDRDGRILADVRLPDGQSLNRELVRSGTCWWYRKRAPADGELERLESEARSAHKGLWAVPDPVPPWEWRKQHRDPIRLTPLERLGHILEDD